MFEYHQHVDRDVVYIPHMKPVWCATLKYIATATSNICEAWVFMHVWRDLDSGPKRQHIFFLVQDLFDAPAAEQKVEALFKRLDNSIGHISSQQVLAMAHPQSCISQVLAQWGGHGLGERTLWVHLTPPLHGRLESASDTGREELEESRPGPCLPLRVVGLHFFLQP